MGHHASNNWTLRIKTVLRSTPLNTVFQCYVLHYFDCSMLQNKFPTGSDHNWKLIAVQHKIKAQCDEISNCTYYILQAPIEYDILLPSIHVSTTPFKIQENMTYCPSEWWQHHKLTRFQDHMILCLKFKTLPTDSLTHSQGLSLEMLSIYLYACMHICIYAYIYAYKKYISWSKCVICE